jgi:hypothetical protein
MIHHQSNSIDRLTINDQDATSSRSGVASGEITGGGVWHSWQCFFFVLIYFAVLEWDNVRDYYGLA